MELQVAPALTSAKTTTRVLSVDVLRGIVMFTMVFVNDAYGAEGMPWWMKNRKLKYVSAGIRILGVIFLIYLAAKFRTRRGGTIEPSWWGILGLIGWAYFGATTVYLLLRKERLAALVGAMTLMMCVYFGAH